MQFPLYNGFAGIENNNFTKNTLHKNKSSLPPLSGTYLVGLVAFNKASGKELYFTKNRILSETKVFRKKNAKKDIKKNMTERDYVSLTEDVDEYLTENFAYENSIIFDRGIKYEGIRYVSLNQDSVTGVFLTITDAFSALNSRGISGPVTLMLTDSEYPSETFPLILYNVSGTSPSANIRIIPSPGIKPQITGSYAGSLVKISGTNYVSFDGAYYPGNTKRNLSFKNLNPSGSIIWIGNSDANYVHSITFRNINLQMPSFNTTAFFAGSGSTYEQPGRVDSIYIENIFSDKSFNAFYIYGEQNYPASNIYIDNVIIDSSAQHGIYFRDVRNSKISRCDIRNFKADRDAVSAGVFIHKNCRSIIVDRNKIHDLRYTGSAGYGRNGIRIQTDISSPSVKIMNNLLYNITGDGDIYAAYGMYYSPVGIYLYGYQGETSDSTIYLYNNSIYMYGNSLNTSGAYSSGIAFDLGSYGKVYNNNIVNNCGVLVYGAGASALTISQVQQLIASDNNNLYSAPSSGLKLTGKINLNDYDSLYKFVSALNGKNMSSCSAYPNFLSLNDLRIDTTSSLCWVLYKKGYANEFVSEDYRGISRVTSVQNGTICIGAFEFETLTSPPVIPILNPQPGTKSVFEQFGKKVMEIQWGDTINSK